MKIKVHHYSYYWECGDGCCSQCDEVSIFYHNGKEYEYRSYDSDTNTVNFVKEILGIEFVESET